MLFCGNPAPKGPIAPIEANVAHVAGRARLKRSASCLINGLLEPTVLSTSDRREANVPSGSQTGFGAGVRAPWLAWWRCPDVPCIAPQDELTSAWALVINVQAALTYM